MDNYKEMDEYEYERRCAQAEAVYDSIKHGDTPSTWQHGKLLIKGLNCLHNVRRAVCEKCGGTNAITILANLEVNTLRWSPRNDYFWCSNCNSKIQSLPDEGVVEHCGEKVAYGLYYPNDGEGEYEYFCSQHTQEEILDCLLNDYQVRKADMDEDVIFFECTLVK